MYFLRSLRNLREYLFEKSVARLHQPHNDRLQ